MLNKRTITGIFSWVVILLGLLAFGRAAFLFPLEKIDLNFLLMVFLAFGISIYLKLQLPHQNTHISFADSLVFLVFWLYGSEVAVLFSAIDALYASFNVERVKESISPKLILLNFSNTALSTFITVMVSNYFFGNSETIAREGGLNPYVSLVVVMVVCQFLTNSLISAIFISDKSNTSFWTVWNESVFTTLIVFVVQAVIACALLKVILEIDVLLFVVTTVTGAILYASYKHYLDEIRTKSLFVEKAERERADLATKHIEVLNHHLIEQEKISAALRESREQFQHAAYHDSLTSLPNRNFFLEELKPLMTKVKENPRFVFAVLYLDLNRFKTINDSLGHNFGDQLLELLTKRLSKTIREGDILSRFSGDEFAILVKGVANIREVEKFAERLQKKIKAPFNLNGRQVYTSASIGIALSSVEYERPEEMLRDSDIAMFYAKENRRDFAVFAKSMHSKAFQIMELETDLQRAVEKKEFEIYYQPIIELQNGELCGFEALMRWNHPEKGMIPPSEFIPLTEQNGLIIPITIWLLKETCRQLKEWETLEKNPLKMSVNLSSYHLVDNSLPKQLSEILEEVGLEPSRLKLEITESAAMQNAEQTIEVLKQLTKIGVQLSIDDFGTGYSSLSYLHRFPIDTLKIDRSFVSAMTKTDENQGIIQTIVALAETLKLDVIAEGIETVQQAIDLSNLNCAYGQGYLFSRPVPKEEIEKMLFEEKNWSELTSSCSNVARIYPISAGGKPKLRIAK